VKLIERPSSLSPPLRHNALEAELALAAALCPSFRVAPFSTALALLIGAAR